MTYNKKIIKGITLITLLFPMWYLFQDVSANETWKQEVTMWFQCGSSNVLLWSIYTTNPSETKVSVNVSNDEKNIDQFNVSLSEDNWYNIIVEPTKYEEWFYSIEVQAALWVKTDTWTYKTYMWDDCDSIQAIKERMVTYANEAWDYFDNEVKTQPLPKKFLATWLWEWIDWLINETSQKFASSSVSVFHDVPEWTKSPNSPNHSTFEEQYAMVPDEYRDAYAYVQFKWLLIPINLPEKWASEEELLNQLNTWWLMAPETRSLDMMWSIKMIYTHSLSYTQSPFSWVWSYLSIFSDIGDTVTVFVKNWYVSYDKRTYSIKNRLQISPEQTGIITDFKKEWADSIALITCKDWNVLWSLKWREVLLLERDSEELWSFQKSLTFIHNIPSLTEKKEAFDTYVAWNDLDDEAVARLVKKLEQLEDDEENPLAIIWTYWKYMASYDAIYNG